MDYEELASLNSTFRRIDTCSLSVILEESKRSTGTNSISSEDDNLALENLELHLFENKGASVKTFSTGVKASGSEKSSKKNIPRRGSTFSLECKNIRLNSNLKYVGTEGFYAIVELHLLLIVDHASFQCQPKLKLLRIRYGF